MAIIQGIGDKNEKKQIFFKWHKASNFFFKKIKKFILANFFEVKKTSLFDLKSQLHQLLFSLASFSSSSNKVL